MNEATVRRIVSETLQAAAAQIAAAAQAQNSENSDNSDNIGSTTSLDPTARLGRPQFRPRDVGYFDPAPGPAIEVKDNHNVYHNVFSFTTRLRVKATTMNASLLRQNLDSCLLSAAENWYTNELAHLSRIDLRNDINGVKEWCNALEARFRDSSSKSLATLEAIRYTVKDARSRRDPLDY